VMYRDIHRIWAGRGRRLTMQVPSTRGTCHGCHFIHSRQSAAPADAARYDDARALAPHAAPVCAQRPALCRVQRFAAFLKRPQDTATSEDLRNFQIYQHECGANAGTINSTVSALRFFYTVTLRRRDLARGLVATRRPHTVREVLSVEEATHLLEQDVDIRVIQVLLGHAKIDTTAIYTKVSTKTIQAVASPLDRIIALMEGKTPPG
jgi:site-specific recombinase XerD